MEKVLVVYAIESYAKEIDKLLCNLKSPRYIYCSYRNTDLDERLAALCKNEQYNKKEKYEILHDMKLKKKVQNKNTNLCIEMEEVLMEVKNNDN